MFRIVDIVLADLINSAIDKALVDCPEAESSRPHLFQQLLDYYDEHGTVPDFRISRNQGCIDKFARMVDR